MMDASSDILQAATGEQDPRILVERAVSEEARTRRALQLVRWPVCALSLISGLVGYGLHVPSAQFVFLLTAIFVLAWFRAGASSKKKAPETPLLTTLKEHPKKIVWLYATETRDVFGLVRRGVIVIGRSNGRMLHLPVGSTNPEALLSALSALAPAAEVGYSEQRVELYLRNPKRPPRVRGPMSGPQIAGVACAACGDRLVTASQGSVCADCDAPLHLGCVAKHAMTAHAPKSVVPYR